MSAEQVMIKLHTEGFSRKKLTEELLKDEKPLFENNENLFKTGMEELDLRNADFNLIMRAGYLANKKDTRKLVNNNAGDNDELAILKVETTDHTEKVLDNFLAKYETIFSMYELSKDKTIMLSKENKLALYYALIHTYSKKGIIELDYANKLNVTFNCCMNVNNSVNDRMRNLETIRKELEKDLFKKPIENYNYLSAVAKFQSVANELVETKSM